MYCVNIGFPTPPNRVKLLMIDLCKFMHVMHVMQIGCQDLGESIFATSDPPSIFGGT